MADLPRIISSVRFRRAMWLIGIALIACPITWLALRPVLIRHMLLPRLVLRQPQPHLKSGWLLPPGVTVGAVAISPNGRVVWSGGAFPMISIRGKDFLPPFSATIQAWDARSSKPLYSLPGNGRVVEALAVSPDDRFLASSGWNNTVTLWDTRTHQLLWTRPGDSTALTFSPDSHMLMAGGTGWNTATGKPISVLTQTLNQASGTALSPDGTTFACVTNTYHVTFEKGGIKIGSQRDPQQGDFGVIGRHAQLWNIIHGTLERTLPYNLCQDVAFSPNGLSLACLCEVDRLGVNMINGAAIYLVDAHTGTERWRWIRANTGNTQWSMNSLIFSPDGKWIAAETLDDRVAIFDAVHGTLLRVLTAPGSHSRLSNWMTSSALAFSQDSKTLAVRSYHSVQVWDVRALEE